jgi:hypothetical protein
MINIGNREIGKLVVQSDCESGKLNIRSPFCVLANPMDSHHSAHFAAHEAAVSAASHHHASSVHHNHSSGGGDGSYNNYYAPPPPPPKNTIITLTFTGMPSHCGCAADMGCGAPSTPTIAPQYFVDPEAQPYISLEELNNLAAEINSIFANNYMPPMPLMFTHFCIPFSPICVLSHYAARFDKALNEFIDRTNRTTYLERNCHW